MAEEPGEVPRGERGAALIVALLVVFLLFLLSAALLSVSDIENGVSANDNWSEGAFYAAEAGVQAGIDQVGINPTTSIAAIPLTTIGTSYTYRSGSRTDTSAQPLTFIGTLGTSGYSLGSGTGYNGAGYVYNIYQINATGSGPRNALREVEVQVSYGPVPR